MQGFWGEKRNYWIHWLYSPTCWFQAPELWITSCGITSFPCPSPVLWPRVKNSYMGSTDLRTLWVIRHTLPISNRPLTVSTGWNICFCSVTYLSLLSGVCPAQVYRLSFTSLSLFSSAAHSFTTLLHVHPHAALMFMCVPPRTWLQRSYRQLKSSKKERGNSALFWNCSCLVLFCLSLTRLI